MVSLYNKGYANALGDSSYYHSFRVNTRLKKLLNSVDIKKDNRILDIGCNIGIVAKYMMKYCDSVFGIDGNEAAVQIANHPNIRHMNALSMDFEDNSFDTIIIMDVIEHIPDTDKLVREVSRVLSKEGKLILIYPWEPFRGSNAIMDALKVHKDIRYCRKLHVHKFNPKKIKSIVGRHNMKLVSSELFFGIFPTFLNVCEKL